MKKLVSKIKTLPTWAKSILWFAAGAMTSYGFAPYYLWPLTVISIGLAYYFLVANYKPQKHHPSSLFLHPFLWAAGYGLFKNGWTLTSVWSTDAYAAHFWWFIPIGALIFIVFYGLFMGPIFWLTNSTKSTGARRVLYFAIAWTLSLWLFEMAPFGGWPWNPIANLWINTWVANLMAYIGAIGLTFLTIGMIATLAEFINQTITKRKLSIVNCQLSILFFLPLLFVPFIHRPNDLTDFRVRIVQPAFSMNDKIHDPMVAEEIAMELIRMSRQRGMHDVNLVIWPETAWPYVLRPGDRLPGIGRPLAAGANYETFGREYNILAYANEIGRIVDMHIKFKLTPFGEYRPFGRLVPTPGGLSRGSGPSHITNFIPTICHEIITTDTIVPQGAKPELIVNIANFSWFGNTSGQRAYIDMVRRQAIETGLPVAHASYGGISAIIDTNGRVIRSTQFGERTILDGNIPVARDGITVYRRLGPTGIMLIILLFSTTVLLGIKRRL